MILLKKFLACFSLLFILAATNTAFAKPAEITGINAFNLDKETVRIEISYRGGKLDSSDVSTSLNFGILSVEMHNTLPGRVSRVSGTQIDSGARDFIDKILANETQPKLTKVQIQFKSFLEGDVQVSFEPSNRSGRKADRVVIDVKTNAVKDKPLEYFDGGDKVIVLDPGHGGSDSGAIGPSGVTEKYVALEVSLKARDLLTASGYQVVMTRTTDVDVAAPGVPDSTELQARVDKAPSNAALFISVHCNAFSNGKANGMETYHAPTAVQGARLARLLNEELERLGGLNNRGVKAARFYVMTHSQCPASLIELGFITNPNEERLLASDDYQHKLAQAITNAVNRYFNQGGFD
ncbi:MAG: N-acetylmuramoyl-L-alanine amidase [Selenomonadaceae bacterium]|nr:N-acetylmuramoyl-L-alanine amidase [Selenomonadaceae bacterium]